MKKIRILPQHHRNDMDIRDLSRENDITLSNFFPGRELMFFNNARSALHFVLGKQKLDKEDEIYITTSSGSNYVSSCVTSTAFNYAKVSRALSEHTKIIIVIHEFGVVHPRLSELYKISKKRNIPLIEDCAHTLDSSKNGIKVGMTGDYAIYSLYKHFPIEFGGLLTSQKEPELAKENQKKMVVNIKAPDLVKKYLPYVHCLSRKRKENFNFLRTEFKKIPVLFEGREKRTPYFLVILTPYYKQLYEKLNCEKTGVEWGKTHVKNWFVIPTNPFLQKEHLMYMVDLLKAQL